MSEPLLATEAIQTTEEREAAEKGAGGSEPTLTEKEQSEEESSEKAAAEKAAAELAEKAEAEKGAPETYEFTAPKSFEGVEIDGSIHAAYGKAARELNLPQDKAQKLFDTTMSAMHQRAMAEQGRITEEWIAETKADKDIGGDKLEENLGIAKKAMEEFGSDGLRELLSIENGIGDHPEVIRFLVKIGRAIGEDGFVGSNKAPIDIKDEKTQASILYPNAEKRAGTG